MRSFIGIEIGGTKLQLVVGDDQARILDRHRLVVDRMEGADGIRRQIREKLQRLELRTVQAIGIGFGGPVDYRSGKILTSYQIEGWGDFRLSQWIEELTGVPAWIDNDANVAALGEALHGSGKGYSRVFYVTMGSGVGAGLVVNGQLYRGAGNSEMELGHVRLDKTGRTVESACSGWAVDKRVREYVSAHPDSLLHKLTAGVGGGEAKVLAEALAKKDPAAKEILSGVADDFALGLSHVAHLVNPEVIVLGGGLSLLGDPLRVAIEEQLPKYLMDILRPGPPIKLSALREDAVPTGALSFAITNSLNA